MGISDFRVEFASDDPREYGAVSRSVMRNKDLTPESKAIYAYIASFAGEGDTAFPSVALMMDELGMSKKRFYKHREPLIDAGLIVIRSGRRNGSRYEHNIYYLPLTSSATPSEGIPSDGGCQNDTPQCSKLGQGGQNDTPRTLRVFNNPQVDGWCRFGTVQNDTTKDGRMDGCGFQGPKPIHPTGNPVPLASEERRSFPEDIEGAFSELDDASVNRNRLKRERDIAEAKTALSMLAEAYPLEEVVSLWKRKNRSLADAGKDPRFFPQLLSWLTREAKGELKRAGVKPKAALSADADGEGAEEDPIAQKLREDIACAAARINELNSGRTALSGRELIEAEEAARSEHAAAKAALDAYSGQRAQDGGKAAA